MHALPQRCPRLPVLGGTINNRLSREIPGASMYSIDRSGRVWSHRGIGRSGAKRNYQMTPFFSAGRDVVVSIIDDLGRKRNRKISDLIIETFGEG